MNELYASFSSRFLERMVNTGRTPGAAWWVEAPAPVGVICGASGWASLEPDRVRLSLGTPFDLASLTKPLCTALLLVLLEDEGKIDPESAVGESIEELRGTAFGDASLIDLATHRAGFAAWRPLYIEGSDRCGYLEQIRQELPAVPRGQTLYSDLGYIVLGIAIERAAGETLDRLFRRRIAGRLELSRLGFVSPTGGFDDAAATERGNAYERRLAGDVGSGHPWREAVIRGRVHDGNAHGLGGTAGHAGLFGTIAELAELVREISRPSRLGLSARGRERLLRTADPSTGRTVGWVTAAAARAASGILPALAAGHTGFTGTSVWIDPGSERFWVLLTNRVHPVVAAGGFDRVRRGFHRCALRDSRGDDRL